MATVTHYAGYLIKVGDYIIPTKYLALESYKVTANLRQDLDPFRDANGDLTRNVVPNMPSKIEIKTPYLYARDMEVLMAGLRANYTVPAEKKASVTFYCPDTDSYKTENMYCPDFDFEYYRIEPSNFDMSLYKPFTLKFIGY